MPGILSDEQFADVNTGEVLDRDDITFNPAIAGLAVGPAQAFDDGCRDHAAIARKIVRMEKPVGLSIVLEPLPVLFPEVFIILVSVF